MLKLRKILLCNYLYIIFITIVFLLSIFRLSIKNNSAYTESSTSFKGIITKIYFKETNLVIYLKNKENIIATTRSKNPALKNLSLGDTLLITGTFKKPDSNSIAYLFNYQKYLARHKIYYLVEIDSISKIKSNKNIYYLLKQKMLSHLKNDPYLNTFILGDKSYLNPEIKRSYQENGISHLFAISGMHITLIASIIGKLLKKLKLEEITIFKIIAFFLLIYLSLVGLSPSILRGVLFYLLFSINKIYYFYIKPINLFIISLGTSLLFNPNYIYDIGFQYSYAVSLALIVFRTDSQSSYLKSLWKTSLLSFISSLPITLYNFHQLNLLSIIYNLFFVPFISIIVFPLSLITTLFKPLLPLFNLITSILENISLYLNTVSFGKIVMRRMPIYFYLIYIIVIIIYFVKKRNIYLMLIILIITIHHVQPLFDHSTYIKMLDIGQGDSILIHSHNKNILIDTGGVTTYGEDNRDGRIFHNILSPAFKSLGIQKIDFLILTHGDKDHLGEAETLIANIPVKKIVINNNRINYYERNIINKNTIIGQQELKIQINDLILTELNENLVDENDSSQIYLLNYNKTKILLTGDASIKSEMNLLKNYKIGNIDILKVGHHGSKTSTSEELLRETKPKIALISSGKDNKFNHPHKEVIDRLKDHHVKIYNTQEVGTITIDLDRLTIKTTK